MAKETTPTQPPVRTGYGTPFTDSVAGTILWVVLGIIAYFLVK